MIFRLRRSVDCTERGGKQVTNTNERLIFFSIIIECNMMFTSSVETISYKWPLFMVVKHLKLANASETLKSLSISQSSQTRSRNRRIFHVFFLQLCS